MSLIYGWVADLACIVLAVVVFIQAGEKGRIAIPVLMGAVYGVPRLWPSPTVALVCFLAKIILAIGCAIYVKWSNAM